jgi:RNA polymerase primary sigma factor
MVNREQDVMDRVSNGHVSTGPLDDVFTIEAFDDSVLNPSDDVFAIDAVGHAHGAAPAGTIVSPEEGGELDLFK